VPVTRAELTRLAAATMLETFPNTTMTLSHMPGPGWVAHRWGWTTASQFALVYRRRFGELPSQTLRT